MKKTFRSFWISLLRNSALLAAAAMAYTASAPVAFALQIDPLRVAPPAKIRAKRGESVTVPIQVKLQPGYHVNSNTPSEDYLIPLRLTWDARPLEAGKPSFPKPHLEKYEFSEKPLSVFTGDFAIETTFTVPSNAASGMGLAVGKLRFQACSLTACLPPKTIEVKLPVDVL